MFSVLIMAQSKPSYEDDDYEWINHKDKAYRSIFNLWPDDGLMQHEKAEEEAILFTGSDYPGNNYGFNMYPDRVHPAALREHRSQPTSTAPDNKSKESLEVVIQRVRELLILSPLHVELVLSNLIKKNVKSNHDLYIAVHEASNVNNSRLSLDFMSLIKDRGVSLHKE